MPFDPLANALIFAFILLAMLCVGLAVRWQDIVAAITDKRRTGRALVANLIIAPLVAIGLVAVLPVPPATATVILLLGFAPGGINAVQFSTKSKGYLASAAALLFILSLASLITAPLAAGFVLGEVTALPIALIVSRAVLLILMPLFVGIAIRNMAPEIAEKLYKPAMLVSTISFVASVLVSISQRQDALSELGTTTAVAFVAFVLILMLVGWVFGGPESGHRQVMAVATNLRNVGIVYVIVAECCVDTQLPSAVLAYMALMVPPNLVLTLFLAFSRKRRGFDV
jgi:BASS family bile acid:Na+ symporter